MNLNLRSEVVTWNEYQRNVNNLCKQITDKYDFLIGVFQGGYIVALSIADTTLQLFKNIITHKALSIV